jgi:hypothetical protein
VSEFQEQDQETPRQGVDNPERDQETLGQDAAYRRLRRLSEDLEDREFMRQSRVSMMRTRELVESQEALDGAQDRLFDAVREARTTGMDWSAIADALRLPQEEVEARYRSVDRM